MLFTFPSRYWFTIGLTGVFSLAGWSRRIRAGFHVSRVTQVAVAPRVSSHTGLSPSVVRLSNTLPLKTARVTVTAPTTPNLHQRNRCGLGSSPFARHYWGNHCYFLFLEVLRCFSSLRLPRHNYMAVTVLQTAGLSHSDTRGSRDMCSYPRLFAAYRVLHRLREPRHPPCALSYFLSSHRCNTNRTGQLILSAVASPPPQRKEGTCSFDSCYLQSCLCQYVKDLMPTRGGWRMSESRRHRSNTTARLYLLYTKGQKRTRSPGDDETIHDF